MSSELGQPAVFHITHWKAGSQWVRAVLADSCPERFVDPDDDTKEGRFTAPVRPGGIYSPLYVTRDNFMASEAARVHHRKFIVLRDPRDTLVSWYFSLRSAHPPNDVISAHRRHLEALSVEDGLHYLLTHADFFALNMIHSTWQATDGLLVHFEELLQDAQGVFERVFDYCLLETPEPVRRDAVDRAMFERQSGRPRGHEDPNSHYRKGIAGDWRNHFTPRIRTAFCERWGKLLVNLGYEPDGRWHKEAATPRP